METLRAALQDGLSTFAEFIPRILGAAVLIIIGFVLGRIVGKLVTKALQAVKFNEIAEKAEIDGFMEQAGIKADPSAVVGMLVKWAIYLTFFLMALNALGLTEVGVLSSVLAYLPLIVVALIILFVGALVGKMLATVVKGFVGSMGMGSPELFGSIARFAVIGVAVIMALNVLNIAPTIVSSIWIGAIVLVVGTFVIAFGLGGRKAAEELLLGRMLRAELEPGVEIQSSSYSGKVKIIGSLFTTIETESGIIKVPNAELSAKPVKMSSAEFTKQQQQRKEMKEKGKKAVEEAKQEAKASTNGSKPKGSPQPVGATRI